MWSQGSPALRQQSFLPVSSSHRILILWEILSSADECLCGITPEPWHLYLLLLCEENDLKDFSYKV
jgi:hypothetical protein